MPTTQQLIDWALAWQRYIEACLGLPIATPNCRPVWEWVMIAGFTIGGLLLAWVIWQFISYRLKLAAALRAQAEREAIAPPEVMDAYKVKEVGDLVEDITDPNMAEKIRAELDAKRLKNFTGNV